MKLKTFSVSDIRRLRPCYDPVTGMNGDGDVVHPGGFITEDWTGTALDVLKIEACPAEDRLCLVLRDGWIDDRTLRLFAVWCAREAQKLVDNPDPRSIAACDTAERYAFGGATDKELIAAWDTARAAARDAAEAAAWDAAWDVAWSAAEAAAWAAAEAAAKAADWTARIAARAVAEAADRAVWDAAEAAAWDAQIKHLIAMLEDED